MNAVVKTVVMQEDNDPIAPNMVSMGPRGMRILQTVDTIKKLFNGQTRGLNYTIYIPVVAVRSTRRKNKIYFFCQST